VAWRIRNKILSIVVDPNMFKPIDIPIAVVGEVSGMVFKNEAGNSEGLGRITLDIFDKDNILVGRTMSEFDGYYNYLGLAPGNYVVKVDAQQSKKLHLTSTPSQQEFTIRKNRDGDIVEGKDFGLKQTSP
jgi:hypothetical protein